MGRSAADVALNPGSPALPAGESETTQPKQSGKSLSCPAKIPGSIEHKPRRRDAGVGDPGEGAPLRFRAARLLPLTRARSLTKVHFVSGQEGVRQPGRPAVAHLRPRSLSAPWRRRVQANRNAGARDSRDPRVRNSFAGRATPRFSSCSCY